MLAQPGTRDSLQAVHPPPVVDSTRARPVRADTLPARPIKSAGTAMLLSAVLPGAGQLYNHAYWKVPVVAGLGAYFVAGWLDNNRKARDYRAQYAASITPGFPDGNLNLSRLREFYKDQRDAFAWYFFILYLINIADAYVDAKLFDFNVGGDLSLRSLPAEGGLPPVSLTVRIHF
jgi:hypothetical protein